MPSGLVSIFHRIHMPCCHALQHAMDQIRPLEIARVAPQHGSVLQDPADVQHLIERLSTLDRVGIDGVA